ncbi:hypothetical protein EY06_15245, partial [Staphylococcus aureus]
FQVERQQRGRNDDERRRSVAVQRDHHGQHGGTDHELHGVVAHQSQNAAHQRIEQADVNHDAEEDDREEQQGGGGGQR